MLAAPQDGRLEQPGKLAVGSQAGQADRHVVKATFAIATAHVVHAVLAVDLENRPGVDAVVIEQPPRPMRELGGVGQLQDSRRLLKVDQQRPHAGMATGVPGTEVDTVTALVDAVRHRARGMTVHPLELARGSENPANPLPVHYFTTMVHSHRS